MTSDIKSEVIIYARFAHSIFSQLFQLFGVRVNMDCPSRKQCLNPVTIYDPSLNFNNRIQHLHRAVAPTWSNLKNNNKEFIVLTETGTTIRPNFQPQGLKTTSMMSHYISFHRTVHEIQHMCNTKNVYTKTGCLKNGKRPGNIFPIFSYAVSVNLCLR